MNFSLKRLGVAASLKLKKKIVHKAFYIGAQSRVLNYVRIRLINQKNLEV